MFYYGADDNRVLNLKSKNIIPHSLNRLYDKL